MKRGILLACLIAVILLAAVPAAAQLPPSLAGSWQLTLTPTTPPVPAIQIPALATFTTDGSVIETDGSEAAPLVSTTARPVFGTPGHGIWQPAPAVGTLYIQFFSLMVNSNSSLHATRNVIITGALDPTGTIFNGAYTAQVIDPTGHVISMTSGAVVGQKIPHPLLP